MIPAERSLETAKTVLLLILVAASMYLSLQIWRTGPMSLNVPTPRAYVQEGHAESVALTEAIRPALFVHADENTWYGLENAVYSSYLLSWDLLRSTLQRIPVGQSAHWAETVEDPEPPYVRIDFPYSLRWPEWRQLWQADHTQLLFADNADGETGEDWPKFHRIVLQPQRNGNVTVYVYGEQTTWSLQADIATHQPNGRDVLDLVQRAAVEQWPMYREVPRVEGVEWEDDKALVRDEQEERSPLRVEPVQPERTPLVQSFFSDLTVIRRGTGTNGAELYNDGQRLLSIDQQGLIEYQAFLNNPDTGPQYFLPGLVDAMQFIVQHGGWPKGLYLWQALPIYEPGTLDLRQGERKVIGYHFEFTFPFEGLPVLGGLTLSTGQIAGPQLPNMPAPYQVLLHGGGIQAFTAVEARVVGHGNERPILPLESVLQKFVANADRTTAVGEEKDADETQLLSQTESRLAENEPLKLQAAELIYYAPVGAPWWVPAWLLHTSEGGRIVLDAFDGSLLSDS